MNMKTIAVLVLMGVSLSVTAQVPAIGVTETQNCILLINTLNATPGGSVKTPEVIECEQLQKLSAGVGGLSPIDPKETIKKSTDGAITCQMTASYTIDYDRCVKALAAYNFVLISETGMDLEQKVRTDLKNQSIQQEATKKAQQGDFQTGALDAGIESHQHMKNINTEKMVIYGTALTALMAAYNYIPGIKYARELCGEGCEKTLTENKNSILANQEAKAGLATAIAKFSAKALAAGIALKQHKNAADQIAAAKQPFAQEGDDLMMERCAFNPTDPACAKEGIRIPGQSFSGGNFSFGSEGTNTAFDMTSGDDPTFEEGEATNLGDGQSVASMNSPFVDEAKAAQGILDPAAAAQMQATGGAAGGGGGGAGGGMGGGGGASLGSDLSGEDKEANKEATIKTSKVSGIYSAAGGGGFKGIGKGKDDANPFASLFDAKSQGGVEEDRSIASGDIDGQASGLFQKISKRYVQIHADKRIEANNLE